MKKSISKFIEKNLLIFRNLAKLTFLISFVVLFDILQFVFDTYTAFFIISVLLGLMFENYRISKDSNEIIKNTFYSISISLFSFFAGRNENPYNLRLHLSLWPIFIIIVYISAVLNQNWKKIQKQITEGVVFMQSIAVIYFIYTKEIDFFNKTYLFISIPISFLIILSFLNAFSKINLGALNRFLLSLWSNLVYISLSIYYLLDLLINNNKTIELNTLNTVIIIVQSFFIGVSSIYIVLNIKLLMDLFPKFNIKRKNLKNHFKPYIDRVSDKQIKIADSIFCLIYSSLLYSLNYFYSFLNSGTVIWLVFFSFPLLSSLLRNLFKKHLLNKA